MPETKANDDVRRVTVMRQLTDAELEVREETMVEVGDDVEHETSEVDDRRHAVGATRVASRVLATRAHAQSAGDHVRAADRLDLLDVAELGLEQQLQQQMQDVSGEHAIASK